MKKPTDSSTEKNAKQDKVDGEVIGHEKMQTMEPVTRDKPLPAPLVESSFATLFPKYREKYLRDSQPQITNSLKHYGIRCELDLIEGSMSVATTRKMQDPYSIMKARDFIKLLARSVPMQQALKIMQDDVFCDIIKIGKLIRNRERFVKRRQRLIGPNGSSLKAIELLTNCFVMIQGNTVSAMGSVKGLKSVRRIVVDCIRNVHPIYHIKTLMIKRELEKNPAMKNENWDRFLPKFTKKNVKRRKPKVVRQKGPYTPFPPPQQPSKIDLQLESGEYFLSNTQKKEDERKKRSAKRKLELEQRKIERDKEFKAPKEKSQFFGKKSVIHNASRTDLDKLKRKLKSKTAKSLSNNAQSGDEHSGKVIKNDSNKKNDFSRFIIGS